MMGLAWTYLISAGLFEIGWPVGLKMAQTPGKTTMGVGFAALCMLISGYLLFLAQRHIHMGGAGTFVLGIFLYGEPVRCTYELNPRMKSFQQMSKKKQYQRFNVIVAA